MLSRIDYINLYASSLDVNTLSSRGARIVQEDGAIALGTDQRMKEGNIRLQSIEAD